MHKHESNWKKEGKKAWYILYHCIMPSVMEYKVPWNPVELTTVFNVSTVFFKSVSPGIYYCIVWNQDKNIFLFSKWDSN